MNWKKVLLVVALTFVVGSELVSAQVNILTAKKPEEIGTPSKEDSISPSKPIPYGYVSDRDILWKREVWEFVDLDERVNFPLYYPTEELSARKSLFMVLKEGLMADKLDVYRDSYFSEKVEGYDQIEYVLSRMDTLPAAYNFMNANPGEPLPEGYVNKIEILPQDIQGYKIRGVWYFDKRQGELKYRLIGIAPVSKSVYDLKNDEITDYIDLFWVWYPSARELMYEAKAFNERNSATPISFDHLLNSRRFSATIYKVENVYGDRDIDDYIQDNALFQLLESDRIKEQIRDMEQDMWTY
ncbi:gliding motility protein GldO [Neptunitalea chrysea]|uniref:Gliding motility protein GldO n=1 Tax=Neptunitalea chrysea TaxID=1647581 RepID=A0A9W6EVI4_9FLAO|nr:gliding motility protein GldN [Neptunitalea chrysea]GLB51578.1 gliding motility protein GldO [Neptunitalea chrysea]